MAKPTIGLAFSFFRQSLEVVNLEATFEPVTDEDSDAAEIEVLEKAAEVLVNLLEPLYAKSRPGFDHPDVHN